MQTKLPVSALVRSDANVRGIYETAGLASLKSSILSVGLISALSVVPDGNGNYGVVAGGRRLQALSDLVKEGLLPEDYEVKVDVVDPAGVSLSEVSLAENFAREAMSAADEVLAFKQLADEDRTVEEIAHKFALSVLHVQQRLALANLHPRIIENLRRGAITLDVARAFAMTPDQERQNEVFESFLVVAPTDDLEDEEEVFPDETVDDFENEDEYNDYLNEIEEENEAIRARNAEKAKLREERGIKPVYHFRGNAWSVKAKLSEDAVRGDDPRALLIGAEEFVNAGGRVSIDLFPDREDSRVFEPQSLLEELTEARMRVEADRLKEENGYAFVRPLLSYYVPYNFDLHATTEPKTDEEKAEYGRVLLLDRDGTLKLDRSWYTPQKPKSTSAGAGSSSFASLQPQNDLGDKAIRELSHMRRSILRTELMRRPELATALLVFQLAEHTFFGTAYDMGSTVTPRSSYEGSSGIDEERTKALNELPAALEYAALKSTLNYDWTLGAKPSDFEAKKGRAARFRAFLELPQAERDKWGSYIAASTLQTTAHVNGMKSNALHDDLGLLLEIDVRKHFTPTVDNYFGYVKKALLLALLAKADKKLAEESAKLKAGAIQQLCEDLCAGKLTAEQPKASEFFATWVPNELRFAEAPKPKPEAKPKAETTAKPKARKAKEKPKGRKAA